MMDVRKFCQQQLKAKGLIMDTPAITLERLDEIERVVSRTLEFPKMPLPEFLELMRLARLGIQAQPHD